jgi:hypothetical protein
MNAPCLLVAANGFARMSQAEHPINNVSNG